MARLEKIEIPDNKALTPGNAGKKPIKKAKPKVKAKKAMGRPRISIDWDLVDMLATYFCTVEEIAQSCHVDTETLSRRCVKEHSKTIGEYIAFKAGKGKASLRNTLYSMATRDKNVTAAIFLAKSVLGLSDKPELMARNAADNQTVPEDVITPAKFQQMLIEDPTIVERTWQGGQERAYQEATKGLDVPNIDGRFGERPSTIPNSVPGTPGATDTPEAPLTVAV